MDQSIRRRTDKEQRDDLYRSLYEAEHDRRIREYESEFGPEFRAKHPFKVDSLSVHMTVMQQLEENEKYR